MNDEGRWRAWWHAAKPHFRGAAAILGSGLAAVLACSPHLLQQEVWNDEVTQLAGLQLSPLEVVRWLAGEDADRFDVPADRMPPLSYWIGWCWSRAFGLEETPLRVLSVLATAGAAMLAAASALRLIGPGAAAWAGAIFVLSPNTVTLGVEIRAYPLWIFFSAVTLYSIASLVIERDRRRTGAWLLLASSLVLGMLTHFFGILVAGGCLLALGVDAGLEGRRWRAPAAVGGLVALTSLALFPLVTASQVSRPYSKVAPPRELGGLLAELTKNVYRSLVGHPALTVEPGAAALALSGFAGLLLLGAVGWRSSAPRARRVAGLIACTLGIALVVTFAAQATSRTFEALEPRYGSWRLPWMCLLLVLPMGSTSKVVRRAARGLAALLVVGSGAGTMQVWLHPDTFTRSPNRRLVALIDDLGVGATTVVHDGAGIWELAYSPLRHTLGAALDQRVAGVEGEARPAREVRLQITTGSAALLEDIDAPHVVVVLARNYSWRDTAAHLRGAPVEWPPAAAARRMAVHPEYRLQGRTDLVAQTSVRVWTYSRR